MTKEEVLPDTVIDEVVTAQCERTGDILGVLEELQKRHPQKYLPKATLAAVARRMHVALSQVYSVATFYSFFNLVQQGRRAVMVCRGTACHTRGARTIVDRMRSALDMQPMPDGESYRTADGGLVLRTVACFGQCALAPVLVDGERIHGNVTDLQLDEIIKGLRQ